MSSLIILQRVKPGDVRRSRDIERVVHALEDLPCDKSWSIKIEEQACTRTREANAYYWSVVVDAISQHTGYEPEEVHEYLCGLRWGWRDKKVPKTPRNPEGVESVPVRTTTTDEQGRRAVLKILAFYDFVEFARRFAVVKLGVYTPDPDKNWKLHREHEQEAA